MAYFKVRFIVYITTIEFTFHSPNQDEKESIQDPLYASLINNLSHSNSCILP